MAFSDTCQEGGSTLLCLAEKANSFFYCNVIGSRLECWWAQQDLNLRPTDYESAALTN